MEGRHHLTRSNLRILLRAIRRESPRQILRNLRRLLRSKVPKPSWAKAPVPTQEELYQLFLERETIQSLDISMWEVEESWIFPHTASYRLAAHARAELAHYLREHPGTEILYCDEDQMDESGRRHSPCFKAGWSPELLLGCNYIRQPLAVRKSAWEALGGVDESKGDDAFWDLLLRAAEAKYVIGHLPKVLMHAVREIPNSPRSRSFAKPQDRTQTPTVSILIPSKNNHRLLKKCLHSLQNTTYPHYEILILDNASDDPATLACLQEIRQNEGIRVLSIPNRGSTFSYAYINNQGAKYAESELLLLLNDDTEVIHPDWLSQMVSYHSREGVGMVGAKLLYPDGSIQHAGVGTDMYMGKFESFPIHLFAGQKPDEQNIPASNVAAVTAACCLISKALFEQLGGFDEKLFPLSFNDIDLCLRVRLAGKRIVLAHEAILIHKESKSRKGMPEFREMIHFKKKYRAIHDPYYNPNFSRIEPFQIRPFGGEWQDFQVEKPISIALAAGQRGESRSWQQLRAALAGKAQWQFVEFSDENAALLLCCGNAAAPLLREAADRQLPVLWYLDEIPDEAAAAVMHLAFGLIVPSHRMRSYVGPLARGVPVEIIKMAIDPQPIADFIQKTDKAKAREKLGIAENQLVILHQTPSHDKGARKWIEAAFNRLNHKFPQKCLLINAMDFQKNEMYAYRAADIFVQTAMHSTDMCQILQAMHFALPILSHADIGVGEYVLEDCNALLVPTGDKLALYQAMKRLLDDELRSNFGELSREIHYLDPFFVQMVMKYEFLMLKSIFSKKYMPT